MRLECAENEKRDTINVLLGLFFDGCSNCRHHIDYYSSGKGNPICRRSARLEYSDEGNYTNVASLYKAYMHTLDGKSNNGFDYVRRVYLSGSDDFRYGRNMRVVSDIEHLKKDIFSKVKKACEIISRDIALVVDAASENLPISQVKLTLDVYGGGRGATAARCFVNSIDEPHENVGDKELSLSYWLNSRLDQSVEEGSVDVSVEVRFLGLYDTVSSSGQSANDEISNVVLSLGIGGENSSIPNGVHFCAADEFRGKYALTTTDSIDGFEQYIFPGSHADIGGGYNRVVHEPLDIQFFDNLRLEREKLTGFQEMPDFVKEGWFHGEEDADGKISVEKERVIVNTYSLIFLFLMVRKSVEDGLDDIWDSNALSVSKALLDEDSFLSEVRKRVDGVLKGDSLYSIYRQDKCQLGEVGLELMRRFREGSDDGQLVKALRGKYIHLSSNPICGKRSGNSGNRLIIKG